MVDALVALWEDDDEPPSWRRALRKVLQAERGGATLEVQSADDCVPLFDL